MAVLAGAVGGVLILGLGGRAAMVLAALHHGTNVNLSLRGVNEVLVVAVVIGSVGGLLLLPMRILLPTHRLSRGVVIGALLFSGSLFIAWATGRLNPGFGGVLPITLFFVAIMYALYGIVIEVLFSRFEGLTGSHLKYSPRGETEDILP